MCRSASAVTRDPLPSPRLVFPLPLFCSLLLLPSPSSPAALLAVRQAHRTAAAALSLCARGRDGAQTPNGQAEKQKEKESVKDGTAQPHRPGRTGEEGKGGEREGNAHLDAGLRWVAIGPVCTARPQRLTTVPPLNGHPRAHCDSLTQPNDHAAAAAATHCVCAQWIWVPSRALPTAAASARFLWLACRCRCAGTRLCGLPLFAARAQSAALAASRLCTTAVRTASSRLCACLWRRLRRLRSTFAVATAAPASGHAAARCSSTAVCSASLITIRPSSRSCSCCTHAAPRRRSGSRSRSYAPEQRRSAALFRHDHSRFFESAHQARGG